MEGLPLIPGFSFSDPTIHDFKRRQKFSHKNGHRTLRDSYYGIGQRPIDIASSAYLAETDSDPIEYDPSLTYGRVREYGYSQVIPHYALFAQKCLNFQAFFRQGVFNSPDEHFRIRHVNIIYFLEDDTMCVMEPTVVNSGFQQGRLVRRDKIIKDRDGRVYHWKDLNVGIDIGIYGVVYHTVDCDLFTHEFLKSQGVDVGEKEEAPVDPYTQRLSERNEKIPVGGNQSRCNTDDSRRRFLEYDGMVLCFDATWNEDSYQIMYFLTDDTIAVKEIHKPNDGKDPIAMLLKRTKVPKNWKNLPSSYPSIYLEVDDPEVVEYYTPKDLRIGDTIFIFGRRFLLHDCNSFTRKYYSGMLCSPQPPGIGPTKESSCENLQEPPKPPPHIKFGTPEDTLASCQSFVPKPPKKDVVRELYNFPKKLRYLATMEAVHPEDEDRDFIIDYALSDGKITISEIEKRNSGRRGGCFLSSTLVPKPATGRDNPLYYTPEDFFIDAKINVYNHRFVINGIDLFVYRYVEANPDKFCRELRDNLRNYVTLQGLLEGDIERKALKNLAAQDESGEIEEDTVEKLRTEEENIRICENELAHGGEASKLIGEEERCRETLLKPECLKSLPMKTFPAKEEFLPSKRLVWADQVDKDLAGHPIISCKQEVPECPKRLARRSCLKISDNMKPKDQRLEVILSWNFPRVFCLHYSLVKIFSTLVKNNCHIKDSIFKLLSKFDSKLGKLFLLCKLFFVNDPLDRLWEFDETN